MKEIEVKAYLNNRETVIAKLTELGCTLSEPIRQIDTVYSKISNTTGDYNSANEHFLRIRKSSDGKILFTVKEKMKRHMASKEFETEVSDGEALEQAIFLMGYSIANGLDKTRATAHYKDYEICLDDVQELGSFIEVEKFSEEDPDKVTEELFQFLTTLGVAREDQVFKKYDTLIMEKMGK
jgi:adenylate cyclase class 2